MSFSKLVLTAVVLATVAASGCGPGPGPAPTPGPGEAYFEMNNDTYDNVDVYIDGVYMDTILTGETHDYDLGLGGYVHNIQIAKAGDTTYVLNNVDEAFASGVTTWNVYDNAPVITVQNNYAPGTGEALDLSVDGVAVQFAIENGSTVAFDSTLLEGETGFYLTEIGSHQVVVSGYSTANIYYNDVQSYVDGTHLLYSVP